MGSWCSRKADVYYAAVTKEGGETFEVTFVLRLFDASSDRWLCRFQYPSGRAEEMAKYADLRLLPVSTSAG